MFGDSEAEEDSGGSDVGEDDARPTSSATEWARGGRATDEGEADPLEGDCKGAASGAEAEDGKNQVDR